MNRPLPARAFDRLRYPRAYGGRDEEALQSRRRTDQRTASKDARAETPYCAEGRTRFQFVTYRPRGRSPHLRTERSSGAADGQHGRAAPNFDFTWGLGEDF